MCNTFATHLMASMCHTFDGIIEHIWWHLCTTSTWHHWTHLRGIIEHIWYDTMYHQCSLLSHYQVQLRLPKQDSNQKAYQ